MNVFNDYAYYYNAFYRDKNYKAEAEQVMELMEKHGKKVRSVMNFGCGTGRHDLEFAKQGYRCFGIDSSSLMIKIANENAKDAGADVAFSVADIRDFEPPQKYDAVISLFHVISYQNSNEDVLAAFRSARKALDRGGVFLFDAWYGPGVLSDKPAVRVREVEDADNRLVRIARPLMHDGQNLVDVCYEVLVMNKKTGITETIRETHKMRYFFKPEIEWFLREAGFALVDHLDCATLGKTDFHSWTCYFVAEAR